MLLKLFILLIFLSMATTKEVKKRPFTRLQDQVDEAEDNITKIDARVKVLEENDCCVSKIPSMESTLAMLQKFYNCESKGYTYLPVGSGPTLCVKMSNEVATQTSAKAYCETESARLVTVDTQDKYDTIQKYLSDKGQYAREDGVSIYRVWIGLEKGAGNSWMWSDGTENTLENWEAGEPDLHLNQNCVQFLPVGFSDMECYKTRLYMCETVLD